MSQPVRWGVIGLGFFGEVHAEVLATMPGVELTALCTRRENRLKEVAGELNVNRTYQDYQQLLADPDVDCVSITTHVVDHLHVTLAALKAGKHVFLEKPMAPTAEQCDQIIAAAKDAPGHLMVGHICRFDPRAAMAKEAIAAGRIGKIVSMHSRRNLSKTIGEAHLDKISALMGDGIHDADLMLWFTEAQPVSVYAQEVHPGKCKNPDAGFAMVRLEGGAVGVIESVWHLPEKTPYTIDARMEIIGTEGALYINCAEAGLEIHDQAGAKLPDTMYWPNVAGHRFGVLRAELEYFTECIRQNMPPTRITAEESRAVVRLMEGAERSSKTGEVVRF